MDTEIPSELQNDINNEVLSFINDKSAHDGVADELLTAIKPLGDVQVFCPDAESFRYIVVSTNNVIFGIAYGMSTIVFRLDPVFKEKALSVGCKQHQELKGNWVWVNPNQGDWPQVDVPFWTRKSYLAAREGLLS